MFEAQQAHYFSLPSHLAIASVTSAAASAIGLDHRIGYIKQGYDADLVLWNSHPLQLGATPQMVWVDGILEVENANGIEAREGRNHPPKTPDWGREREETIKWEGLPPLEGERKTGIVVFTHVKELWTREAIRFESTIPAEHAKREFGEHLGVVVVKGGLVVCTAHHRDSEACLGLLKDLNMTKINLHGGSISPGFTTLGSILGIEEMQSEKSTGDDGPGFEPLVSDVPKIIGDKFGIVKVVDALNFGTRDALYDFPANFCRSDLDLTPRLRGRRSIYRIGGVTTSTTYLSNTPQTFPAPFIGGLSVTFRLGATNSLEEGAIVKKITALHVAVEKILPASVSTQVAILRKLLLVEEDEEASEWFVKAAKV